MTPCVVCADRDPDWESGFAVCRRDWGRMAGALRQIPGFVAELAGLGFVERDNRSGTRAVRNGSGIVRVPSVADPVAHTFSAGPLNAPQNGQRVSGTPSHLEPLNLDLADLTAPARLGSVGVLYRGGWSRLGGDPDQIGYLSIATELDGYARMWAQDRGERSPDPRVPELCRWLLDRLDWACSGWMAIDEFAQVLSRIYGALYGMLGYGLPRPEILPVPCKRCGWLALYRDVDDERIACGACPALMTEGEYGEYVRGLAAEYGGEEAA